MRGTSIPERRFGALQIIGALGILVRPVKPGDDRFACVCNHRSLLRASIIAAREFVRVNGGFD
jgi:hypothetical protein